MSAGAFCPICRCLLSPSQWNLGEFTECPNCRAPTRTLVFPALARDAHSNQPVPRAEAEAGCFFHSQWRAENLCNSCGRFLCSLCTVSFGDQRLCPDCIRRKREESTEAQFRDQAILFDNWALLILIVPILCLIYIYFGLIFSVLATAFIIIGWRRQQTVVPRGRYRFVLAAVLAVVEGGSWIALVWLIVWLIIRHSADLTP